MINPEVRYIIIDVLIVVAVIIVLSLIASYFINHRR